MRTLLILRHGQAAREDDGADHERALTPRGKEEAEFVGKWLCSEHLEPDRIISSAARRARDTARRVARVTRFSGVVDEVEPLYLAEPDAYVNALKLRARPAERALLVGHNPGLEALVLILTGKGVSLPTAALAVCALPITDFSQLSLQVRGKMTRFVSPKLA